MHLVERDILLYLFKDYSHSFLIGLEGQAQFAGRESTLTMDSRFVSGDNGDAITICIAVCCRPVSVDSCATCMATVWSKAVLPVFCSVNSKLWVPVSSHGGLWGVEVSLVLLNVFLQ